MKVLIDPDLCENSGCCATVCPESVFELVDGRINVINAPACTNCWICVDNCVAGAIAVD